MKNLKKSKSTVEVATESLRSRDGRARSVIKTVRESNPGRVAEVMSSSGKVSKTSKRVIERTSSKRESAMKALADR